MSKLKQSQVLKIYNDLMKEIKTRSYFINRALDGSFSSMPKRLVVEFGNLHLRLTYELIALSSIVAHADLENISSLKKEYKADVIIKKLEGVHSDFFPRGCKLTATDIGYHLSPCEGCLTKKELIENYRNTGNFLHRGQLKKYIDYSDYSKVEDLELEKIRLSERKISRLLNVHDVALVDPSNRVICLMNEYDKDPQTLFAQAS